MMYISQSTLKNSFPFLSCSELSSSETCLYPRLSPSIEMALIPQPSTYKSTKAKCGFVTLRCITRAFSNTGLYALSFTFSVKDCIFM